MYEYSFRTGKKVICGWALKWYRTLLLKTAPYYKQINPVLQKGWFTETYPQQYLLKVKAMLVQVPCNPCKT